jgi:putative membrane protein
MRIKLQRVNLQIFLESLCCLSFTILLIYLVKSGKYLSYVTPRMKPYLYFSAIVMAIWTAALMGRMFQLQYKVRSMHCLVLAIPILLVLLPHAPLGVSDVTEKYSVGGSLSSPKESKQAVKETELENTESSTGNTPAVSENAANNLPGLDAKNSKITVSNEDFALWLAELDTNLSTYEGYTIEMTGFVFNKFEVPKENEFVVSRLAMTCCIADLSSTGVRCIYDKASELESETWVTVEGTISIGEYNVANITMEEPLITVASIKPADPVEEYIYPLI